MTSTTSRPQSVGIEARVPEPAALLSRAAFRHLRLHLLLVGLRAPVIVERPATLAAVFVEPARATFRFARKAWSASSPRTRPHAPEGSGLIFFRGTTTPNVRCPKPCPKTKKADPSFRRIRLSCAVARACASTFLTKARATFRIAGCPSRGRSSWAGDDTSIASSSVGRLGSQVNGGAATSS
jgi:hypothetical protein